MARFPKPATEKWYRQGRGGVNANLGTDRAFSGIVADITDYRGSG
jgi:hypothetical protein